MWVALQTTESIKPGAPSLVVVCINSDFMVSGRATMPKQSSHFLGGEGGGGRGHILKS